MKIHNKATNKRKICKNIYCSILCIYMRYYCNCKQLKARKLSSKDIDINNVKNGIYTGSADNKLVKATVSVEVNNGKIQNINILKHDHLLGKPAEKITTSIIKQQSLDVDAITSATYSSNTIRKAVENALRKGE